MEKSLKVAIENLENGKAIIIFDSEDREAEGDIAFSAKFSTPELVNMCLNIGRGLVCVSMPSLDAERLQIRRLNTNNKDKRSTPFGMPVDLINNNSGISAASRSATIKALADPKKEASHFIYPGHIHTLIAHPEGLKGRIGHTEAIVDLLKYAGIGGSGVLCEVLNDNGSIASYYDLQVLSKKHKLPLIEIELILKLDKNQ